MRFSELQTHEGILLWVSNVRIQTYSVSKRKSSAGSIFLPTVGEKKINTGTDTPKQSLLRFQKYGEEKSRDTWLDRFLYRLFGITDEDQGEKKRKENWFDRFLYRLFGIRDEAAVVSPNLEPSENDTGDEQYSDDSRLVEQLGEEGSRAGALRQLHTRERNLRSQKQKPKKV
jgi:hypothetical protein